MSKAPKSAHERVVDLMRESAPRTGRPRPRKRAPQPASISVTGDGNVVAGGDATVRHEVHHHAPPGQAAPAPAPGQAAPAPAPPPRRPAGRP